MSKKAEEAVVKTEGPKLKEEVLLLAEKIEKGLKLDKKTGVASEDGTLYENNLPEDLDMSTVKKVSDYNSTFVAAGSYAFGKMAVAAMAKDAKLEQATAEIKMGDKDSLGLTVVREKNVVNHLAGGETIVKYGVVSASYDVRAGKNGGELKKARTLVAELAMQQLAKS